MRFRIEISTLLFSFLVFGVSGALPAAEQAAGPVSVELVSEVEQIAAGDSFRAGVRLTPRDGWRVFGEDPGLAGIPIDLSWMLSEGVEAERPRFPDGRFFSVFGEDAEGYEEPFLVWSEIHVSESARSPLTLTARVAWMAFDENDSLEPGEGELSIEIPVGASTVPSEEHGSLFGRDRADIAAREAEAGPSLIFFLFAALLGGLILNLMPCVFPILGIKIMGFVRQAGEDRAKIVTHGLVFTAGVLASFWILAGILIALRAGGEELGWGFQLQEPAFILALTVVLLVFGLNMSGVFEIGLSATGVGSGLTGKSGTAGSFFSGVLATVVATPCAAPFLAPALGAALTLPPFESLLLFTAVAIGLALPYLTLSAFPALVARLPRPGTWMESLKQFLSFLLYGTVAYLLWVLADQVEGGLFLGILFALVLVAMACWVYGRWSVPHRRGRARWLARAIAAVLFLAPLGYAWSGIADEERRRQAIERIAAGEIEQDFLIWQDWSPEKVEELRGDGRYVYIDFTARWCATCQVNKRSYESSEVIEAFLTNEVALLRADWTNQDPAITRALAEFGRSAIPFNVLYAPDAEEPIIFPELFGPGTVLEKLGEAGATW